MKNDLSSCTAVTCTYGTIKRPAAATRNSGSQGIPVPYQSRGGFIYKSVISDAPGICRIACIASITILRIDHESGGISLLISNLVMRA